MSTTSSSRLTFIVDDNADYHTMLKTTFEEVRPNTRTKFFFSGQALLDQLSDPANQHPDLIILDLFMPEMDGLTTLNHIRQNLKLTKIPTIIMSVSDSKSDLLNSYQAGANSFIKKPSRLDEFMKFIDITCRFWLEIAQVPSLRRVAF
ncbi:two-component system response regulator [Larkinella arboricola]|uniref:Two-component system response regulator n=1 Tax=Larkinella arboricola TaxID=643671 RepID=A0A327X279_LARAB|nr:response regulator [Larkinella arboricola]RAK00302.1 two-component system response regulator [Larkinella arboricola]